MEPSTARANRLISLIKFQNKYGKGHPGVEVMKDVISAWDDNHESDVQYERRVEFGGFQEIDKSYPGITVHLL